LQLLLLLFSFKHAKPRVNTKPRVVKQLKRISSEMKLVLLRKLCNAQDRRESQVGVISTYFVFNPAEVFTDGRPCQQLLSSCNKLTKF